VVVGAFASECVAVPRLVAAAEGEMSGRLPDAQERLAVVAGAVQQVPRVLAVLLGCACVTVDEAHTTIFVSAGKNPRTVRVVVLPGAEEPIFTAT
jgi:hypothetical protein